MNQENGQEMKLILPDVITVTGGWGDTKIRFKFKMITVREEQEHIDRLAGNSDLKGDALSQADYRLMIDMVNAWSVENPVIINGKGEQETTVTEIFEDWSIAKDRLMNQVLSRYRMAMVPEISFL